MTSLAVRPTRAARGHDPATAPGRVPTGALPAAWAGLAATALAAVLVVARPVDGVHLAALTLAVGGALIGGVLLLTRRPELAAWAAVGLFATSAELKLRVSPTLGVAKDGLVVLLVGLALVWRSRHPGAARNLKPLTLAGSSLAVLVGLYVVDPAGPHNASWLAGTRLLLEVLALLLVGLVLAPARTLRHLVAAMTLVLPAEAVLAWLQQRAGLTALVYQWGYQYGAQVRVSSGGSLRTSGTFEDPFQLAALAVLGLTLALFVAGRRQALVLIPSALAVLAATSVRTAVIQSAVLVLLWAVRRGWWRPAAALAAVAAVAGVLVLATTTSAVQPGAKPEPLLFSLNGRSTAWSQAVGDWESLLLGNGVGARGTGSTVTSTSISTAPSYDPTSAPTAAFAGSSAFLDSSYAQVQSDVGIVGTAALAVTLAAVGIVVIRRCAGSRDGAAWAAGGLLVTAMIDWVGRSSLSSYTTGFLTLYVLGALLGASSAQQETP